MNKIVRDVAEILTPIIRFDPVADISVVAKTLPSKLVTLPPPVVPENAKRRSFILDSMTAVNVPLSQDEFHGRYGSFEYGKSNDAYGWHYSRLHEHENGNQWQDLLT